MTLNDHTDTDIPDPVSDDAPEPSPGESVRAVRDGLIAADHDGARYCMECANPDYVELCREDPYAIPYGGPVPDGAKADCPGYACDHCLRSIEGFDLLHYGGVCHPDTCPQMD